nr:hypothetical protein [Pseudomonas sp. R4-39-08]
MLLSEHLEAGEGHAQLRPFTHTPTYFIPMQLKYFHGGKRNELRAVWLVIHDAFFA